MFDFAYFASLSVEAKAFFRLKAPLRVSKKGGAKAFFHLKAQLLVIKIRSRGFSRIYARKLNSRSAPL
jgi:hypothetical protein